jgi:hypothetical protein
MPATIPPSEEMGGEQVPNWEAQKQQRRGAARAQNHEGELDGAFVIREKPPTPLEHTGDRVPWRPSQPFLVGGLQYVRQWPRVEEMGGQPIMRTMHKERASCPSGRIDAMGRGRISTRRNDMASSVT